MISWEELRELLDNKLNQLIMQEREKLKNRGPYPVTADDIWKFNTIPQYQQAIHEISSARSDSLTSGTIPAFAVNLAEDILRASNITIEKTTDQFTRFCEATVRMYLEFTEQRTLLNDEARSFQLRGHHTPTNLAPSISIDHKDRFLLSEVVEKYCNEMHDGAVWTLKTEAEYRYGFRLLIKIINDSPITLVDYSAAQMFKDTLRKMPSNMSKKALYKGKSIKEVIAIKIPENELLSIAKINIDIGRASSLFIWAIKNGFTQLNPFTGIKLKDKVAGRDKKIPFEASDLKTLFSTPIFQKAERLHPHYYWLPLLGLFTGARINELCQLCLDNIYQKDDLWVIDINDDDDRRLMNLPRFSGQPVKLRG